MTPEPQVKSAVATWQRWIAVPVIAVSTMVGALLVLRGLGALMHRLVSAEMLESIARTDVREGLVGAIVAAATVASASRTSAGGRRWVAVGVFVAGALLAWLALHDWYFPESHPRAYEPSAIPLYATWSGGALGVATVWWAARRCAATRTARCARSP